MALCNFGDFYLVSKIPKKLLKLEPRNLVQGYRLAKIFQEPTGLLIFFLVAQAKS